MKHGALWYGLMSIMLCYSMMLHPIRSFFSPRSQSVDAARDLVGWQEYINRFEVGCCYGALALIPEYTSSFNSAKLAEYFFGTNKITVSGSKSPLRGPTDLLADYFGLPTDFSSTLVFAPTVSNGMLDIAWYVGLDSWCKGSYVRVQAPIVHTRWNLDPCECIHNPGVNPFPAGYMASSSIARPYLPASVKEVLTGTTSEGDIQPIIFGKVCGPQSMTRLAEVQIAFGYNPVLGDGHHFGWNIRLYLPTGSRSRGVYFFEPVVGNGGHWELGVGFTGHGIFWTSEDATRSFGLYGDINITHLFASHQRRSFDLEKNGVASRYMLLEELGNPVVDALTLAVGNPPSQVPARNQYHGRLVPAINYTTLYADIRIDLQLDMAIKASYRYKNLSIDLGYDGWVRTSEKICKREPFPDRTFAVKGDANVYGFTDGLSAPLATFVGINATQSRATMHAGQGAGNITGANANADNAALISFEGNQLYESTLTNQISGSAQAIFIKNCDISDLSGLALHASSHTFFVHLSYDWATEGNFVPYLGAGARVEMDSTNKRERSALSQWGVWLKCGLYH